MVKKLKQIKYLFIGKLLGQNHFSIEFYECAEDKRLKEENLKKISPAMQETQVLSLGWEDPLEKGMAAHSSILA